MRRLLGVAVAVAYMWMPAVGDTVAAVEKAVGSQAASLSASVAGKVEPVKDDWGWQAAMREVAAKFTGTQGVVLHIGDSITYASPYGAWARGGAGQTESDKEVLKWMHTGDGNERDGWYLAAFDVPDRGGSYTAVSGMPLDQALAGGFRGMPAMSAVIKKYNPQVVIFMLGTNDATAKRPVAAYKADLEKAIQLILANNTVLVLSTLPPHVNEPVLGRQYNEVILDAARRHKLPLIDFHGEIVSRRPGKTWDGTLMNKGDVHPSAVFEGAGPDSEPTAGNLAKSGYLLRGWLSVQKMKDVKKQVIDPVAKK